MGFNLHVIFLNCLQEYNNRNIITNEELVDDNLEKGD